MSWRAHYDLMILSVLATFAVPVLAVALNLSGVALVLTPALTSLLVFAFARRGENSLLSLVAFAVTPTVVWLAWALATEEGPRSTGVRAAVWALWTMFYAGFAALGAWFGCRSQVESPATDGIARVS